MKKIQISLLLLLLSLRIAVAQQILQGKVIRIADGDTVTILDKRNNQTRVRLYGIDCPEKGQDFGSVARKFTSDLCFGQQVKVIVKDKDRYGRTVGLIFNEKHQNINLELLNAGLAWHYTPYDKSKEFAQAQANAKNLKLGLWAHPNPVAPWEFRKNKKGLYQK
ncbi:thermonuclease family protein [Pseudopedobacter beijingensis]|uniref:Thermonuclease family protein n=1 Tax=Pseudopedobacter beijingensis TaxID=1207056 RepID=A0ABW4IG24_9SPHI